ncbi:MAG: hypothetical protein WDN44_08810 [Sphingomonas sp.]
MPKVSVSVPVPIAAVLSATAALLATCAAASWRTSTEVASPATEALASLVTLSTAVFELVGWVLSVPPEISVLSAESNPVIPLLRSDTAEILAVSASFCWVSVAFLLANCASTSWLTSALISIPDPVPSVFAIDSMAMASPCPDKRQRGRAL